MARLFWSPDSTNAVKVDPLLAELGPAAADVERVEVALRGERPTDLAELHPFGLIPVLVDGDLVISESNVILRYLAERAGRDDLRGVTPADRARIDVLLDSLSLEVRPVLWAVEEVVLYGHEVDGAQRAARLDALRDVLGRYERLLDRDGPYARGGTFTIADCAIAGRLKHLPRLGLGDAAAPRITRVLDAVRAR